MRRAFSVLELLTVITSIATLCGILLTALGGARDAARRVACGSNLRSNAAEAARYLDFERTFTDVVSSDALANPCLGARDAVRVYSFTPTLGRDCPDLLIRRWVEHNNPPVWGCPVRSTTHGDFSKIDGSVHAYAVLPPEAWSDPFTLR